MNVFPDEILTKILIDEEVGTVPCGCQATMLNAIERIISNDDYEIKKKGSDY